MSEPDAAADRRQGRALWVTLVILLGVTLVSGVVATVLFAHLGDRRYGTTSLGDLVPGDCVSSLDWAGTVGAKFDRVPCTSPHAAELIHQGDMSSYFPAFPGVHLSKTFAQGACETANKYHLHVSAETAHLPHADVRSIYVSAENWRSDPEFRCFLVLDDGAMLKKSYFDSTG